MNEIKEFEIKKICFKVAADIVIKALEMRQTRSPRLDQVSTEILLLAIGLEKYTREKKYWQVYSELNIEQYANKKEKKE